MIDLEKEREEFEKSLAKKGIELRFIHIVFDDGAYRFSDKFNDQSDFHNDALHEIQCVWESWQERAELAQQEIEELKAKLAKYENDDVVAMPRKINHGMFEAMNNNLRGCCGGVCTYEEEAWAEMIEAGEIK